MLKKTLILASVLLALTSSAQAAVSLSTISVASGVATVVTGSAHGLTVNAGFCLSAPANVCAVAKTITNSTTFTFDVPTNVSVAACAASCGTGDVAPKVAVLQVVASQSTKTFNYVLWLTTLTPLPRAGTTSQWTVGAASAGATTAENNALAAGSFLEVARAVTFPSTLAIADVQTYLQNDYLASQAALAGNTQPAAFYGFVWTGTAWVQQ